MNAPHSSFEGAVTRISDGAVLDAHTAHPSNRLTVKSTNCTIPSMPVELTPPAAGQLAKLPRVIRTRVTNILERLEKWPEVSGAKSLTGNLAGRYRIRTGDYRLQFRVAGGVVVVERIGHRDGFYDE